MIAEKNWFLLIMLTICVGILWAANSPKLPPSEVSQDKPLNYLWDPEVPFMTFFAKEEKDALRGLQGVNVSIVLDSNIEKYGLTKRILLVSTELQLRRNGIRVLSEKERLLTPGRPVLHIFFISMIWEKAGVAAISIIVKLQEDVILLRDQTMGLVAFTWNREATGFLDLKDSKNTRDTLKNIIDEFCNDYLAANPKEKEEKQREER